MLNQIKILFALILFFSLQGCEKNTKLDEFNFLVGTWQIEGKNTYESWEMNTNKLIGKSYKLINGEKQISESLEVKIVNDKIKYVATVFNQNDGKGISFTLVKINEGLYSFENLAHDFPKKIQYKIESQNKVLVSVLGENDKGFSYIMNKK